MWGFVNGNPEKKRGKSFGSKPQETTDGIIIVNPAYCTVQYILVNLALETSRGRHAKPRLSDDRDLRFFSTVFYSTACGRKSSHALN